MEQQYGGLLGMLGGQGGGTLPNGLEQNEAWKAYMPGFKPSAVPQNNISAQVNQQQPGTIMGYQAIDPNTGLMSVNGLNGLALVMGTLVKAAREGKFDNMASNLSNLPKAPSGFSSAHWQAERERK